MTAARRSGLQQACLGLLVRIPDGHALKALRKHLSAARSVPRWPGDVYVSLQLAGENDDEDGNIEENTQNESWC